MPTLDPRHRALLELTIERQREEVTTFSREIIATAERMSRLASDGSALSLVRLGVYLSDLDPLLAEYRSREQALLQNLRLRDEYDRVSRP